MASLDIVEDCLQPEGYVFLSYSGPDPWGVAKKISGDIKPFFHVSTSSTNQDRLNWDISGDPITFYTTWWVKKGMSGFSTAKFYIMVQGSVSKTDNTGEFTLRLNADLETSFEGPGIILKPVWLMYSYLFYNKVRQGYHQKCRDMLYNFRNGIKDHYNLSATKVTGRQSAYD